MVILKQNIFSFLVLTVIFLCAAGAAAQKERLKTLSFSVEQNEAYQKNNQNLFFGTRNVGPGNSITFLIDTVDIPFIDDFSSNKFKRYIFDRTDTNVNAVVCPDFLVNDTITSRLAFMFDTSYTYAYDAVNSRWDSTPLTGIKVSFIDTGDCETVTQIDTVWPVPEGRVRSGVFVTEVLPDSVIFSSNDTVFIVPPDDSEVLWTTNSVYLNNGMGVEPPTIGVATFDGLDSTGFPYFMPGPSDVYGPADELVSAPIWLKTRPGGGTYNNGDSLYLSFYYQPEGIGNRPEQEDSLILEFYNVFSGNWEWKWGVEGQGVKPFEEVFIPINDSAYFQDGFRFRFRNFATLTGNFDHWNIDYVRVGSYPNINPEIKDDVAFSKQAPSILQDFSRMPWTHYETNPGKFMASGSAVLSYNLSDVQRNVNYGLEIYDRFDSLIFNSSNVVVTPNFPPRTFQKEDVPLEGFEFLSTDTFEQKTFRVVNQLTAADDIPENNRATYHQEFPLHYAYDDRSAEHAYEVIGAGAKIAAEYNIEVVDTLRAVNIYFPPTLEDYSNNLFQIKVWSSLTPEEEIHSSIFYNPRYTKRNLVSRYEINPPLPVSGTIYVGIQQQNRAVFVGFDANFNKKDKFYFNADGAWHNMSFDGSLMINPEFSPVYQPFRVSAPEKEPAQKVKLFPNPARDVVFIQNPAPFAEVVIYDLSGRRVKAARNVTEKIDINDLSTGTYIFQVIAGNEVSQHKIIVH